MNPHSFVVCSYQSLDSKIDLEKNTKGATEITENLKMDHHYELLLQYAKYG